MKLTQKTIFQCFDKSQRQSPISVCDNDEGKIERQREKNDFYNTNHYQKKENNVFY